MRTSSALLAALLMLLLGGAAAASEDAASRYLKAEQALVGGDPVGGVALLEAAAQAGSAAAQLRLAKLAESGAGPLPRDRARAFRMVSALADAHADADVYHPDRGVIVEAFKMLAAYHHAGVPEAGLARDAAMAARLRYQSATILRDPQAQFEIGRMYLDGDGVAANMRIATTFLNYAARARFAPAQAVYGNLIWEGRGVKRNPAQGLALLALGAANAEESERNWIDTLYRAAVTAASPAEIDDAQRWADANMGTYRRQRDVPLHITREVTDPAALAAQAIADPPLR